MAATISQRRARRADRRDARRYQRAAFRAEEALTELLDMEEAWLNYHGAGFDLESMRARVLDLNDAVQDELGGRR